MTRRLVGGLALVASVALMAGCSPPPDMPAGLTPAQLKELIDEQNSNWWYSMFPEEERPAIDPVSYDTWEVQSTHVERCVLEAAVPGVSIDSGGGYIFDYEDREVSRNFNRAYYMCSMRFPTSVDTEAPEDLGFFSPAQLGYVYDYFTERTVPCLRMLGYRLPEAPDRAQFVETFHRGGYWMPYFQTSPQLVNTMAWKRVQLECPPPPLGEWYLP